jgi:hypothetical protein
VPEKAAERRPKQMEDLEAGWRECRLGLLDCDAADLRGRGARTAKRHSTECRIDGAHFAHVGIPKFDAKYLSRIEDCGG